MCNNETLNIEARENYGICSDDVDNVYIFGGKIRCGWRFNDFNMARSNDINRKLIDLFTIQNDMLLQELKQEIIELFLDEHITKSHNIGNIAYHNDDKNSKELNANKNNNSNTGDNVRNKIIQKYMEAINNDIIFSDQIIQILSINHSSIFSQCNIK